MYALDFMALNTKLDFEDHKLNILVPHRLPANLRQGEISHYGIESCKQG